MCYVFKQSQRIFCQQIIFRRAPVTMNIIVDPKKSHQKRSQKDYRGLIDEILPVHMAEEVPNFSL